MSTQSHLRGWPIVHTDGVWRYKDTGEPTAGTRRPCGHCGLPDTPEGHDGCLGSLPDVMNACCGHGDTGTAYVQYPNGSCTRGEAAAAWIREAERGDPLTREDR